MTDVNDTTTLEGNLKQVPNKKKKRFEKITKLLEVKTSGS